MCLLEVRNLWYSVEDTKILRGLNLSVERNSVHAVVGPNGAGKSTLSYAIMGLPGYQPDSGAIVFGGKDLAGVPVDERARLGMSLAWQEPARFEGISVRDFLSVGADEDGEERLREALASVALDPDNYLDRDVDTGLSGGERKRVEVASIIVMRPKLMILDEPDSGIDVEALNAIFELLDTGSDEGTTVLLVTHSREVLSHADVATLMCCGKDVDNGTSEEIAAYFATKCIPCEIHNPDLVEGENVD
ncbi:MAG: ABC transporter ATP-binding protein [Candidatus Brocadiia bacterium]